ncbi:TIGR02450 family Trp-rich protein [Prochlorococcus marinus]|uniref:TIGR02450 family Trp-rich protein n=1 Tax=Prochlorococcus marinus TaxID=1219 RepID=UPI0022B5DE0F|nr:TIGR02450 family Trp-rich protein [Prochlorococcus marinus]
MIWPPNKAWTSKIGIEGQFHFIAINYGGELLKKWVILMSVIDSSIVVKVSWSKLSDLSIWESGWGEINYVEPSKVVKNKGILKTTGCLQPSADSGLTIPINKNIIRPWFDED